jgi:hypothetical protein
MSAPQIVHLRAVVDVVGQGIEYLPHSDGSRNALIVGLGEPGGSVRMQPSVLQERLGRSEILIYGVMGAGESTAGAAECAEGAADGLARAGGGGGVLEGAHGGGGGD